MLATELILATIMVLLMILTHLAGLAIITRLLRSHSRMMRRVRLLPFTILLGASMGLISTHTIEIWLYAAVYLGLGVFRSFEQALYFSTVTYSSIGYGDLVLPRQWRIFGAIEGPAGIMMIGLSTAYFVSLLTQLRLISHDWLRREDEPAR
jgi:voltage-gated potassium channel